jgi:diaminohydroxyphosphoribosylaminopyrimidine deaminase/5-amino-6-(5-phosphoribosylamino)uracil reductase
MHRAHSDELFMLECLALAHRGAGMVSPNPMVGCVIVKNGKVIGRGYHGRFGGPHAEVEAIGSARGSVRGATLYVNLEPCNFHGKTPPCTDLIIRSGIARVVAGVRDPNPRVSGKGMRALQQAGVVVRTGVLEEECRRFNEFFFKYIRSGVPFVTLKIAQSLDGKIASLEGGPRWITGLKSRKYVHALRSHYDAVLVGAGTVKTDNARLTVRHVRGRNPVRVVLDGNFSSSERAAVFSRSKGGRAILIAGKHSIARHRRKAEILRKKGVVLLGLTAGAKGKIRLNRVLRALGSLGIASLLVEGGASVFRSFVDVGACDKMLIFASPRIYGKGIEPFAAIRRGIRLENPSFRAVGEDILVEGYLH